MVATLFSAWASPGGPWGARRRPDLQRTKCSQRHFSRPSIYYGGLEEPSDVLQHCLTLFRRAGVQEIRPYLLPPGQGGGPPLPQTVTPIGGQYVRESGPLAELSGVLDVGARRVLPGHLLRRSRVLSTLRVEDSFQQRVSLTACTGEESVFQWTLRMVAPPSEVTAADSSGGDNEGCGLRGWWGGGVGRPEGGRWVVCSVQRDPHCSAPLPTTPHPKAAPERVVQAQLAALQRADIFTAACFSIWSNALGGGAKLGAHYQLLRDLVQDPPFSVLLHHKEAALGAAALPSQRVMLQEVVVVGGEGGGPVGSRRSAPSARFVWRLGMQANGCWMVTGISLVEAF